MSFEIMLAFNLESNQSLSAMYLAANVSSYGNLPNVHQHKSTAFISHLRIALL